MPSSPLSPNEVKLCPVLIFSSLCPPESAFKSLLNEYRVVSTSYEKFEKYFFIVLRKDRLAVCLTNMSHEFSIRSFLPLIELLFIISTGRFLFPYWNLINLSSNNCLILLLGCSLIFQDRSFRNRLCWLLQLLRLGRFQRFCYVYPRNYVNLKLLWHVDKESWPDFRHCFGVLASLKYEVVHKHCVKLAYWAGHIKVLRIVSHCSNIVWEVFKMNFA